LGGLISEKEQRERDSVPGIEQVPIVSELFSHRNGTTQRTELIIFIRPKIIRNGMDAYRVAEELRAKMRGFAAPHRPPPSLPHK
jgi:general secretion pathway protein D